MVVDWLRFGSRPSQLALELEYACLDILVGRVFVGRMIDWVNLFQFAKGAIREHLEAVRQALLQHL